MTKITYTGNVFNRAKLSRKQQSEIAFAAAKTAKKDMVPDNGGVNLVYDAPSDSWTAQYTIPTQLGYQQCGWCGRGRTAYEAIRDLEKNNYPHPLLVQQAWEQQDKDGHANEQPNKLN